jgi:hypothetical protein
VLTEGLAYLGERGLEHVKCQFLPFRHLGVVMGDIAAIARIYGNIA